MLGYLGYIGLFCVLVCCLSIGRCRLILLFVMSVWLVGFQLFGLLYCGFDVLAFVFAFGFVLLCLGIVCCFSVDLI